MQNGRFLQQIGKPLLSHFSGGTMRFQGQVARQCPAWTRSQVSLSPVLGSLHVTPQHLLIKAPSSFPEHLFPLPLSPHLRNLSPRQLTITMMIALCTDLLPSALFLPPSNPVAPPICLHGCSRGLQRTCSLVVAKTRGCSPGEGHTCSSPEMPRPSQTLLACSQSWPWCLSIEVSASSLPPLCHHPTCQRLLSRPDLLLWLQ